MAALTSILAATAITAGVGGQLLSVKQASKARKREQRAQAEKELEAKNIAALDASNDSVDDPARFSLGASDASSILFDRRKSTPKSSAPATGKNIGGLL